MPFPFFFSFFFRFQFFIKQTSKKGRKKKEKERWKEGRIERILYYSQFNETTLECPVFLTAQKPMKLLESNFLAVFCQTGTDNSRLKVFAIGLKFRAGIVAETSLNWTLLGAENATWTVASLASTSNLRVVVGCFHQNT